MCLGSIGLGEVFFFTWMHDLIIATNKKDGHKTCKMFSQAGSRLSWHSTPKIRLGLKGS